MSDGEPHSRRLTVIVTNETGRVLRRPALSRWLEAVAPARTRGVATVALVPDRTMRRLNRRYAGIDAVTDVLSFPIAALDSDRTRPSRGAPRGRLEPPPIGDIVIACGVAARQAREAGHALGQELRVLALHGLLHLLGHDHHTDQGRMARLEARLRRRGGLRAGLLERARPA